MLSPSESQHMILSPKLSSPRKSKSSNALSDSTRKRKKRIKINLNLEEIKKTYPQHSSVSLLTCEKTCASLSSRRDAQGVEINKRNKKRVRVTFINDINEKIPFVDIINVESYKKYNQDILLKQYQNVNPTRVTECCSCLII